MERADVVESPTSFALLPDPCRRSTRQSLSEAGKFSPVLAPVYARPCPACRLLRIFLPRGAPARLCARPPSAHTNAGRPRAGARWLLRSDHAAQLLAYLCVHPEIFGCEPPKPTSCARSSDVCIATEDGFLLAAFASATRKPPALTRLPSPIVPPDRPLRSSLSRTRATLGTPPAHIGLSSKSPAPDWGRTPACVGVPRCCAGGPQSFCLHNISPPARSSLALSFAPPCCHPRRTAPAPRIARCARSPRTNACIKFAPSICG